MSSDGKAIAKTAHGLHYKTGETITATYFELRPGLWVLQVRDGHVPLEDLYETAPALVLTGTSEQGIRNEALRMLGRSDAAL